MAKAWSEVVSSPEYQAMNADDRIAAQNQYFNSVVAPKLSDPNDLAAARQQFFSQATSAPAPQVPKNVVSNPFTDNTPYKGGQATFKNDNASHVLDPVKTAGSTVAGVLAPVLNVMDKPRNAIAGVLNGVNDGDSLGQDWDNAVAGWQQKKRFSVGDIAFKNLRDARQNPNKNFVNKTISTLQKAGDFFTGDPAKTDALWSTANALGGDIATDPSMYVGVGEGKLMAQAIRAQKLLDSGVAASEISKPMLDALDKVKAARGLGAADKLTQADTLTGQLWNGDKNLTYFNRAIPGTGKVLAPVAGVVGKTAGVLDEGVGRLTGGLKPSDVLFTDLNNPFKGFQFRDAAHTVHQAGDIEGAANFLSSNLTDNTGKLSLYLQKRYGVSKDYADRMIMDEWERRNPSNPEGATPTAADPNDPLMQGVSNRSVAPATPTLDEHGNPVETSTPNQEGAIRPSQGQTIYPGGINFTSQDAHIPDPEGGLAISNDTREVPRNAEGQVYDNGIGNTNGLYLQGDTVAEQAAALNALEARMRARANTMNGNGTANKVGLSDMAPGRKAARTSADALEMALPAKGSSGGTHVDSLKPEVEPTPVSNDNGITVHEQTNPNQAEDINALKKTNPNYAKQATGANKLDRAMRGEPVNPRGRPKASETPEGVAKPEKPEAIPEPKDEAPKDVKADEHAIAKERVDNIINQALGNPEAARIEALRKSIRDRIEAYKASGNDKLYSIADAIEKNILNHSENGSHIPTLEEAERALDRRALNKGSGRKAVEKDNASVIPETKPVPKNEIDVDAAVDKIDKAVNSKSSKAERKPAVQSKPATPKERAQAVNKAAKEAKAAKVDAAKAKAKPDVETKLEDRAGEAHSDDVDNDVAKAEDTTRQAGTKTTGEAFTKRAAAMRKLEDRKLKKEYGLDDDDPLFSGHDDDHEVEPDPYEAYEKGVSREEYEKANDTLDHAKVDEYVKQGDLDGLSKTVEEMQKQVDAINSTLKKDWSKKTTPEFDAQLREAVADIKARREAIEKLKAQQKACK